jgi:hypothetical protein
MTNTIHTPFVVRALRGRFVPAFGAVDAGPWLSEGEIRFQVNGPNGRVIHIPVASNGTFHVKGVRPGSYCFQSSSELFQGYSGIIVIDPAAKERTIRINVSPGA